MVDKFKVKGQKLTFVFGNEKTLNHFKSWLCEQGEQEYWDWMEYREQEEKGNITALEFDYHTGTNHVRTKCGRLNRK
jgi:hypothetical protein